MNVRTNLSNNGKTYECDLTIVPDFEEIYEVVTYCGFLYTNRGAMTTFYYNTEDMQKLEIKELLH